MTDPTELVGRWKRWRTDLQPYWPQIEKNQEMYEFYKGEDSLTVSDVSSNMAFSIVEGQVAKMSEATVDVIVKAKGRTDLKPFEETVEAIGKDLTDNADLRTFSDFKTVQQIAFRELLVKGNVFLERKYGTKKVGGKTVKGPYATVLNLFSVAFDPTGPAEDAREFFVEKFVSLEELEGSKYDRETKRGLYKNLGKLRRHMEEDGRELDRPDVSEDRNVTARSRVNRKVKPVRVLDHWKGCKLTVIAEEKFVIREAEDPLKTGNPAVIAAGLYTVEGRPYAYGDIDSVYKPIRAQDTILNQKIEAVQAFLRPTVLVKDRNADLMALRTIVENGGMMYGDPDGLGELKRQLPPPQSFQTGQELQQVVERAARYNPYANGATSQETDKTQGTASGIQALQAASEPNFQMKLDTLNRKAVEPTVKDFIVMEAEMMDPKEIRWAFLTGESPKWVGATQNVLRGKPTLQDLVDVGLVSPEEAAMLTTEPRLDPATGLITIEEIEKPSDVEAFDVDFVISVRMTNQADSEKYKEAQAILQWLDLAQKLGLPVDGRKVSDQFAKRTGVVDPSLMLLDVSAMPPMGAPGGMVPPGQGMPAQGAAVAPQAQAPVPSFQ